MTLDTAALGIPDRVLSPEESYEIVDGVLTRTPGSPDEESPASPGLDRARGQ